MPDAAAPLIDAAHAAFIESGISISVGACDRDHVPVLVRACAGKVSPDRRRVTIFVSATQAAQVLQCIRDNAAIAVVFSRPSTHRTMQLKGNDTVVGGLQDGDLQRIHAYCAAFADELGPLGFDKGLIHTLFSYPSADIVALSFTPSEAFTQTPGPQAGARLGSGA